MSLLPPAALAHPRLPVTVLTGYAGAGKTVVLQHLLRQQAGQRTAVIISNDSPPGPGQPAADGSWCIRTEEKVVQLADALPPNRTAVK